MRFDRNGLTSADYKLFDGIVGAFREPDLIIAPDGVPYLYRWFVHPRNDRTNTYFHIQVASDPERPLHDHPWDNMSVILSGGYDEIHDPEPALTFHNSIHPRPPYLTRHLRAGMAVFRKAEEAHRLILPPCYHYTMTIFSTGPRLRDWGFWFPTGWRNAEDVLAMRDGMSVMTEENRG